MKKIVFIITIFIIPYFIGLGMVYILNVISEINMVFDFYVLFSLYHIFLTWAFGFMITMSFIVMTNSYFGIKIETVEKYIGYKI